jgi:hypothetical protein
MNQNIFNVLISASVFLLALGVVTAPRSVVINHPAPPDTCKCPPPLTLAEQEAEEKYQRCLQIKRYAESLVGRGPYEIDCEKYRKPEPTPTP